MDGRCRAGRLEVPQRHHSQLCQHQGNRYRLIVKVLYQSQVVYVKFIGTHADYDAVDAEEVSVLTPMDTIKPIKNDQDYRAALSQIDRLSDAQEGTPEFDRLDVLVTLVEAYETKQHPIGPPSPVAAIEYEMEKRGMTRRDLEPILGGSGRVSEILSRQRPLTMTMIRRLHDQFGLSADLLIAPYPLASPRSARKTNAKTDASGSRAAASEEVVAG